MFKVSLEVPKFEKIRVLSIVKAQKTGNIRFTPQDGMLR